MVSTAHTRDILQQQLINVKGLWPSPRDYQGLKRSWVNDLISGVTVGVVALPLALGFGVASGAGAAAGLVTAVVAGFIAAVFGGSHIQVSGPTGAMTVVLLPVIASYGISTIPLLAIMAGVMVVAMGLTSVGRAVDLIPYPVVEGFTLGIGVIIAVQQIPLVTGGPKGHSESSLVAAWQSLEGTDWSAAKAPLAIALLVIVIHLLGNRFFKRLPNALIAITIATIVSVILDLDIARIGSLPASLPAPALPEMNWAMIQALVAPAFAIAGLAALESLLSARVGDGLNPHLTPTNPDRELVGQGLANIGAGLFGGLPATGAIARTAVNAKSGAMTRLASVMHAVVLLAIMMVAGPVVALIPMAALGGVLVVVALGMINIRHALKISRATSADRLTLWLTFGSTVVLDLVMAVLLGMAMAAVMSLRHMANYSVVTHMSFPTFSRGRKVDVPAGQEELREKIALFRIDGALFYGDSRRFIEEVEHIDESVEVVIIRANRMRVFDASGAHALHTVVDDLRRRGVDVIVQGMNRKQIRTAQLLDAMPAAHHREDLKDAVELAVECVSQHARS